MSRKGLWLGFGVFLGGAMLGAAVLQLREASARSAEATVLLAAESYVRALEAVRSTYTAEVVNRLPPSVLVTHDYARYDHAVPLPATFTMALAVELGTAIDGFSVRLFSRYPFPFRAPSGLDEFERLALDSLERSPAAVVSVVEGSGSDRVLRYARGDIMRLECVGCHNSHADSPKKDWSVGDLRGVLEVSVRMASFDQRARDAQRPYVALLILALLGLMGAGVMLMQYQLDHLSKGRVPNHTRRPEPGD